jgi:hypothetical protein
MGISSLLTENSKAIVASPATNTSSKSIVNAVEEDFSINIGYIIFKQDTIYLLLWISPRIMIILYQVPHFTK